MENEKLKQITAKLYLDKLHYGLFFAGQIKGVILCYQPQERPFISEESVGVQVESTGEAEEQSHNFTPIQDDLISEEEPSGPYMSTERFERHGYPLDLLPSGYVCSGVGYYGEDLIITIRVGSEEARRRYDELRTYRPGR